MAKRLLFLDFLRGLGIFVLILAHILIHGVWYNPANALEVLPIWLLGILSPLVILATWAGLFAIISGLAITYNLYDRVVVKGKPFSKAVRAPLFNSTTVLIGHFIYVIFTSHRRDPPYPGLVEGQTEIHTMFTGSAELLQFHITDWPFLFFADALGMIALSGYISVFILWIVWSIGDINNHNVNYKVILAVSLLWLAVSIPVWQAGNTVLMNLLTQGTLLGYAIALPMSFFFGAFQPMFPLAGFTLMGVVVGLLLAIHFHKEEDSEFESNVPEIQSFLKITALFFFIAFIVSFLVDVVVLEKSVLGILEYHVIPYTMFTLNMCLMLLSILVLLNWFEFQSYERRVNLAKHTVWIRRFGLVSLSIYLTESMIGGFITAVFRVIFDDPSTPQNEFWVNAPAIIFACLLILSLWVVFLKYWEKVGFKYGAEYWIVKIGTKLRERQGLKKSRRLDLSYVLYNPISDAEKSEA